MEGENNPRASHFKLAIACSFRETYLSLGSPASGSPSTPSNDHLPWVSAAARTLGLSNIWLLMFPLGAIVPELWLITRRGSYIKWAQRRCLDQRDALCSFDKESLCKGVRGRRAFLDVLLSQVAHNHINNGCCAHHWLHYLQHCLPRSCRDWGSGNLAWWPWLVGQEIGLPFSSGPYLHWASCRHMAKKSARISREHGNHNLLRDTHLQVSMEAHNQESNKRQTWTWRYSDWLLRTWRRNYKMAHSSQACILK